MVCPLGGEARRAALAKPLGAPSQHPGDLFLEAVVAEGKPAVDRQADFLQSRGIDLVAEQFPVVHGSLGRRGPQRQVFLMRRDEL